MIQTIQDIKQSKWNSFQCLNFLYFKSYCSYLAVKKNVIFFWILSAQMMETTSFTSTNPLAKHKHLE